MALNTNAGLQVICLIYINILYSIYLFPSLYDGPKWLSHIYTGQFELDGELSELVKDVAIPCDSNYKRTNLCDSAVFLHSRRWAKRAYVCVAPCRTEVLSKVHSAGLAQYGELKWGDDPHRFDQWHHQGWPTTATQWFFKSPQVTSFWNIMRPSHLFEIIWIWLQPKV